MHHVRQADTGDRGLTDADCACRHEALNARGVGRIDVATKAGLKISLQPWASHALNLKVALAQELHDGSRPLLEGRIVAEELSLATNGSRIEGHRLGPPCSNMTTRMMTSSTAIQNSVARRVLRFTTVLLRSRG